MAFIFSQNILFEGTVTQRRKKAALKASKHPNKAAVTKDVKNSRRKSGTISKVTGMFLSLFLFSFAWTLFVLLQKASLFAAGGYGKNIPRYAFIGVNLLHFFCLLSSSQQESIHLLEERRSEPVGRNSFYDTWHKIKKTFDLVLITRCVLVLLIAAVKLNTLEICMLLSRRDGSFFHASFFEAREKQPLMKTLGAEERKKVCRRCSCSKKMMAACNCHHADR